MFFVCDATASPYRVVVKTQPNQCWQPGSKLYGHIIPFTGKTWLDVTAYMRVWCI